MTCNVVTCNVVLTFNVVRWRSGGPLLDAHTSSVTVELLYFDCRICFVFNFDHE